MNKLSIYVAAIVTIILSFFILPNFVIYLIGCYQIGSWIGTWLSNQLDNID